jgi:hypothetical protein
MEKNNMKKKNECENHVCRETYGLGQQQLWCQFCDELYKNKPQTQSYLNYRFLYKHGFHIHFSFSYYFFPFQLLFDDYF